MKFLKSMEILVSRLRPLNPLPKITIDRAVSVKQKVDSIWNALKQHKKMNFKDLHGHSGKATTREEKVVVIVGFLAMLELVRTGILYVIQENNFEDIMIEKRRGNYELEIRN